MSSVIDCFHKEKDEDIIQTGIYTITSLKTGRIYVGSATRTNYCYYRDRGFAHRWKRHILDLKFGNHSNRFLSRHVEKYGINDLFFEILDINEPSLCESIELYWINTLNTVSDGFNLVYDTKLSRGKSHPSYKNVDEKSIIFDYKNSNLPLKKLAIKYNVSDKKIIKVLNNNHICIKNKNFYNYQSNFEKVFEIYNDYLKMSVFDLCKKHNIDRSTINKYFKIHNLPLKNELLLAENLKIVSEFNNGKTRKQLSKKYNRSRYSIGNAIRLHNL